MINNRIEEVAEGLYLEYCRGMGWHKGKWGHESDEVKEIYRDKARQLSPQPLPEREPSEKILECLGYRRVSNVAGLSTFLTPKSQPLEDKGLETEIITILMNDLPAYEQCQLILALLQPKIEEAKRQERKRVLGKDRPKIVCLCGSTRFVDTFNEWRKKLTLEGCIVVSIELVIPQSEREDPQHSNYKVKQMLDELHLRKIDLADEVMILNVGGYIGNSTRAEIEYAKSKGKSINYLEALKGGN